MQWRIDASRRCQRFMSGEFERGQVIGLFVRRNHCCGQCLSTDCSHAGPGESRKN